MRSRFPLSRFSLPGKEILLRLMSIAPVGLRSRAREDQCQIRLDYGSSLQTQLPAFYWEQLPKTIEEFPQVRRKLL